MGGADDDEGTLFRGSVGFEPHPYGWDAVLNLKGEGNCASRDVVNGVGGAEGKFPDRFGHEWGTFGCQGKRKRKSSD